MQLKEYQFGFADAEKEYTRIPGFFDAIFFDPNSIIDKLIQDYHYLLIGRKGCGKTAYSCKLKSIAERDKSIYTYSIKLNDFEFSNFSKPASIRIFLAHRSISNPGILCCYWRYTGQSITTSKSQKMTS